MPGRASRIAWRAAYHAATLLAGAVALPVAAAQSVASAEARRAWAERLGAPPLLASRRPAWLVAASVGEVRAVEPLLRRLAGERPDVPVVLSVLTPAGRAFAASLASSLAAPPFHPPLDLLPCVSRALSRLRPRAVLVVETELWPNLLGACAARGIPTGMVNGRISARSLPRYRRVRGLVAPVLAEARVLAMRTAEDAARVVELGARPERVTVEGNLKFDAAVRLARDEPALPWAAEAGLESPPWVAFASTAAGEERLVLDAFEVLRGARPALRALLVPRRPERWDEVARLVESRGLPLVRRSHGPRAVPAGGVLLLDTVGELARLYRHAELVFVGGSLVPHGGQNLLEPAAAGRPVLFGPHVQNFRDAEDALLLAGGGVRVTAATLAAETARLLDDEAARRAMGEAARRAVAANEGATRRTLERIAPLLGLGGAS